MKFTKIVLDNGLRLITVPLPYNKTVTAMVLVEAGSRFEEKSVNGISHFLEHMCFKGTTSKPSALEITTEFEKLGASYNAFTSGTNTGYYAKVESSKGETILEMVSDLYLNATLPSNEIEKEKGVVIEEINMYLDKPERIVWEVLDELSYGDHPLGRTVLGTKESVKALTHEALTSYREKHYVPAKTLVVIAGGFDETLMQEKVKKLFGSKAKAGIVSMEKIKESQNAPQCKIYNKPTDQTHFVLGFRSFDQYDKRVDIAILIQIILGGGMSSRLFQRIREDLGLCYYIRSGQKLEQDCGLFVISAGVSNDKLALAVGEIMKEIKKFLDLGPTDDEIQKAKDFKIGNMYLGLETSDQFADWYGFQEIDHEKIRHPEDYEKIIREVTKEEIMKVAHEIFDVKKANLAVVGPHKGKDEDFLKVLKF